MKVGELVQHINITNQKTGIIIKISEPSMTFPYQVASVLFTDGKFEDLVTTSLRKVDENR